MIRILRAGQPKFDVVDVCQKGWKLTSTCVWIDLFEPTREEELRLLRPDLSLTVGGLAAHAIIGAVEERAMWSRFGL